MYRISNKINKQNDGAIALLMVIMITTITLVSAIAIAIVNVEDIISSYYLDRAESISDDVEACVEDAMVRIASSTDVSGTFNLITSTVQCTSTVAQVDGEGTVIVTSTATATPSAGGTWTREVVVKVNVSTTPIGITSYKDSTIYD